MKRSSFFLFVVFLSFSLTPSKHYGITWYIKIIIGLEVFFGTAGFCVTNSWNTIFFLDILEFEVYSKA